jgi:hypothetical protein
MNYKIKTNLLLQSVVDEIVILDTDTGNYYTLDSIGSDMIDLYKKTSSIDRTTDEIVEKYDCDKQTAKNDLIKLLESMAENGLVEKS